jgi:hypothetical protein
MDLHQIFLPVHLIILAYAVWTIIQADRMAMSWVFGKSRTLDAKKVNRHHRNVWIALSGMIVTGLLMFWPLREFLLTRPQFYAKMAFVLTLVINGFIIGRLQNVAIEKPYAELTLKEKLPLFLSGGISGLCWILAAIGGFYLIPD